MWPFTPKEALPTSLDVGNVLIIKKKDPELPKFDKMNKNERDQFIERLLVTFERSTI